MAYKTLVGLEIHVELLTESKIFCSCPNEFGGDANSHTCPVCLGLPGSIPILNKKVIEAGIKSGLTFDCQISNETRMDRKHYFYSDLVKGYQISQDDQPLCSGGYLTIDSKDGPKKIELERIHIEEDTGKSIHTEGGDTLLDYNRAGVPLIEIVSRPDLNSAEETRLFLEELRSSLKYIGVSDLKMEEGSLRCDININVIDEETGEKTNIVEVKNLNSFRAAVRSIEYEEARHIELLKAGKNTQRDTRRWDEVEGKTILMREKAGVSDYRYLYDVDIGPISISDQWIEEIRQSLPEFPRVKKLRFIDQYGIEEYDAGVLTQNQDLADFYEETVKHIDDSKLVSNWIMGDVLRRLNDEDMEVASLKFSSKELADLLDLVRQGKINNNTGKKVLREMFESGKDPKTIVEERGLVQISDQSQLEDMVEEILDQNPQSIEDYKNGRDRAIGYLMGQIMKASKGQANPQLVNQILREKIDKR